MGGELTKELSISIVLKTLVVLVVSSNELLLEIRRVALCEVRY